MTTSDALAVRSGAGMPPNLTRDQAHARAADVQVDSYDVDIDLTDEYGGPSEKTFGTRSTVRFAATPGTSTWIDFVGDGIRSATLNGEPVDISGWTSTTGLQLPPLAAENELTVDAVGLYTNTGEGLHRFVDPEDASVYLYSQFETADAKRLFSCFDQPDLKATFAFTVTAPDDWEVVTNGRPITDEAVEAGPGGRPARRHSYATTARMSTYVTALIAGPYHVVRDTYEDIELGIYCRRPLAQYLDAERIFNETKQGFAFYHANFGIRYPFGKYDQLFVPEFNAGAMENAGAVTFREEYIFRSRVTRYPYERRCETILHEMAHMWFGDLVTMRWWDDLWLNESFATWASTVAQVAATEYTTAWTTFATIEKAWAYVQDQLPSTHPIAADIVDLDAVEVNFDGITYAKGASVLKQLAAYVGFEEFLAGLRAYFQAHAFGNATLQDLFSALEQTSGRDLAAWAQAWLQTTGLNTLSANVEVDDGGVVTAFAVDQSPAEPGAGELRPHRLAIGVYADDENGKLTRAGRVELDVVGARTEVSALVGSSAGQLILINDDDLTYCKARLDPRSLTTAIARVGDITDSLPRSLVWSAVWEMTRDAQMAARDFVAMVIRGIPAETEIGVAQRLLAQLSIAVGSYSEPAWADVTGWPQVTSALLDLATTAKPGGDLQLAAVSALAGAKLSPDLLTTVSGWWDGSAPLAGLAVDTDLHWTLLGALVAHGAAGEADIEAAEAGDPTASGQRRAATVRALRPDSAVKEQIWTRLTEDDGMANSLQDATIGGFSHPAQRELLEPFTDRYFAMVDQVWARRSIEVAQKVVVGLYPRWSISQTTVDKALAWESVDHPAPLKRLVSEGRAASERALRAREKDARD